MKEKEWIILKLFQKYCSWHSSLYQREFLIDALEIVKFVVSLKNEDVSSFPRSVLWYWDKKIQESKGLKVDDKIFFKEEIRRAFTNNKVDISNKNDCKMDLINYDGWEEIYTRISSLKSVDSYHNKIEQEMKNAYVDFGNGTLKVLELDLLIKEFISSRLSLQYSLNKISNVVKFLRKSLDENEGFEKALKNFIHFLSVKNVFKKEKYKIFVPISISNFDSNLVRGLVRNFNTANFKVLHYSGVEEEIKKLNHKIVKDFDKECLYFSFFEVEGVDIENEAYKIVFEKSAFYASLLSTFGMDTKIKHESPIITFKQKGPNDAKVNGLKISKTSFVEIENSPSLKKAIFGLQNFNEGLFGETSKNKKGFLVAKADFSASWNPLEKTHLANRLTELYLKSDYKKGYGGLKKFQAFEHKVANKVWKSLLWSHTNYLYLSNYSAIEYDNSKPINTNLSNFEKIDVVKKWINNHGNSADIKSLWLKHFWNEIKFLEKMSPNAKSQFIGYIHFVFLYVHFKRNAFVHSSTVYNLRDALLAESLEAFLSIAFDVELWKMNKIEKVV